MERAYHKTVINTEPYGYSKKAVEMWLAARYNYVELPWEKIDGHVNCDGIIVRLQKKIDSKLLDKLPKLKFLVTATTGLDHIDKAELENRGIQLFSLRDETDFLD